ncbi:FAS1 domain-containing protein [Nemania sp. NC0429]|nr:FAS1 domain-containing protein [Nemania sp. NC0429]
MGLQLLVASLAVFAAPAMTQSLLAVLRENGFDKYADTIQGSELLNNGPNLVVYVPTDAALERNGNITVVRRVDAEDYNNALAAFSFTKAITPTFPKPSNGSKAVTARAAGPTSGSAYETLLNDPAWVNLGAGHNQTLVEKKLISEPLPVVLSGLGASAKVVADDIPFDQGVIRPIGGVLALPESLSHSLPFLGANRLLEALEKSNLVAELDDRALITVLAPSDEAFKRAGSLADAQLVDMLKQHIIVGFPAYTPLIADGDVYPTLGGGRLTVKVRDGVISIGDAKILTGDAIIKNGVVHTIEKVLTPATPPPPPPTFTGDAIMAKPSFWQALSFTLIGLAMATWCYVL